MNESSPTPEILRDALKYATNQQRCAKNVVSTPPYHVFKRPGKQPASCVH